MRLEKYSSGISLRIIIKTWDLKMKLSKTVQRKVIVDELRKLKCHPTADELYEVVRRKLPRISLGTVYRNLEVLSANGEIQRLGLGRKQMCFDGNMSRHYHLVCRLCGTIEDIMPDGMDGVEKELESKLTDRITGASISFTGYCEKCASQTEKDAQVS